MSESALEFKTTETFEKSFAALPPNLRKRTLEKLTPYETNPHHPSLRVKKIFGR